MLKEMTAESEAAVGIRRVRNIEMLEYMLIKIQQT